MVFQPVWSRRPPAFPLALATASQLPRLRVLLAADRSVAFQRASSCALARLPRGTAVPKDCSVLPTDFAESELAGPICSQSKPSAR